jgi:hypothetical protein
LKSASVLLSVAASAKRHGVNPWSYVKHVLVAAAKRKPEGIELAEAAVLRCGARSALAKKAGLLHPGATTVNRSTCP